MFALRPRWLWVVLVLEAGAVPGRADTIHFKYGTSLECKVVGRTPAGLEVLLGDGEVGRLIIDPATVREDGIDYDFDSRLDELKDDDYQGHYRLGVWCEEQGGDDARMYDRALARYLHVMGKPGIPDDLDLRLGRMFEKCREPDPWQALDHYQAYLKKHPDNAEAKAAVARLQADPRLAQPAPTPKNTRDGLESHRWRPIAIDEHNQGSARNLNDAGNDGGALLELAFSGQNRKKETKDKAAFQLAEKLNLKDQTALLMDIYVPDDKPVRLAVALVTGNNFEWYESKTVILPGGEWTMGVRFDLTLATWKAQKSGWNHTLKPDNLDQVRNLNLLVYNGRQEGKIYVDSVRLEKAEEPKP